jgi:tetratricopeptide (TPR) repeat protein/tRNA A-37 threonylcarbamoyl transferase component Bud32
MPEISGYEMLGVLGQGGMGIVYRARQTGLQREVALKMIRDASLVGRAELDRFQTEAQALASLQHPHIVQVYEVGQVGKLPYFSLEFVSGGCLADRMGHNPQEPRWAATMMETLARAMGAAHEKHIIHRDLKPANVLLTKDGTPKITDFGLAKRVDKGASSRTESGALLGTPSYMAPEQARGEVEALGPPADIYALGAILYEMLTGRPPFLGTTPLETVMMVAHEEPIPPTRLNLKTPRDLETICLKAMAKEAGRRYPTAGELADDLRHWLNGEPIQARPVSRLEKAVKWARRRPSAAAALALSGVTAATLIAGTLFYLDQRANAAESEANRLRVAEQRRQEAEALLAPIEADIRARRYAEAESRTEQALDRVRDQPGAEALRTQLDEQLASARKGKDLTVRLRDFRALAQEATYWQTQNTGADPATNTARASKLAEEALGKFDLGRSAPRVQPTLAKGYFTDEETQEIRDACRELWLVLIWADGYPLPNLTGSENRQRREAALDLLQRLQDERPGRSYYLLMRDMLLSLKRVDAATKIEAKMPAAPVDASDWFAEGINRYLAREFEAAIEDFEEVLRRQPAHFWAHYRLALCQVHQANQRPNEAVARLSGAVAHLDACLAQRRDFVAGVLLRGYARSELGAQESQLARRSAPERRREHEARARAHWRAAESDYQEIEATLRKTPNTEDEYKLLTNRGVLWLHQGKMNEAESEFTRACRVKPKQVQAYLLLAEVHALQGNLDRAFAELKTALELDPRQPELYRTRARLHERGRGYAAALADYDAALKLESPGAGTIANDQVERGSLLLRSRDYAQAVGAFDIALKARPDLQRARSLRGVALYWLARQEPDPVKKRKTYEAAAHDLDEFISQEKPDASVFQSRGRVRADLAVCCSTSDDPDDQMRALALHRGAVEDYGRALDLKPDLALRAERGWELLTMVEAPKLALPDFKEVMTADKTQAEAPIGLALCRVELGNWREAVSDTDRALEQARHLKQETPFLLYHASRVYARAVACIDAEKPDQKLAALRTRYLDESATLLRRSIEGRPTAQRSAFWRELIRKDKAFQAIRSSTGYRKLAQEFDKGGT